MRPNLRGPNTADKGHMRRAIRLYVDQPLSENATIAPEAGQVHYLRAVMRLGPGDTVNLFNGRDGEWSAQIEHLDRRDGTLRLHERQQAQAVDPDIRLAFAPLKAAQIGYLTQKATELGATELIPVITERTQVARINTDRLRANAIEAAEQCERLSVPAVRPPVSFDAFCVGWPAGLPLLAAVERTGAPTLAATAAELTPPLGILIGPEGGFSDEERERLSGLPFVTPISLGPRILRADTAAVAALALVQSTIGDWANPRPMTP